MDTINLGSGTNTGDGEPIRTAFGKVNSNFALTALKGDITGSGITMNPGILGATTSGVISPLSGGQVRPLLDETWSGTNLTLTGGQRTAMLTNTTATIMIDNSLTGTLEWWTTDGTTLSWWVETFVKELLSVTPVGTVNVDYVEDSTYRYRRIKQMGDTNPNITMSLTGSTISITLTSITKMMIKGNLL